MASNDAIWRHKIWLILVCLCCPTTILLEMLWIPISLFAFRLCLKWCFVFTLLHPCPLFFHRRSLDFFYHNKSQNCAFRIIAILVRGQSIIKSTQYTGGDFMFLYRFVRRRRRRRRRRRPQILVHAITFEQLFGFLSFLARLLALTCRLPDKILGDFRLGLKCDHRVWTWPWPWPWIFKVKYRICYISAKIGPIATKRKANLSIKL